MRSKRTKALLSKVGERNQEVAFTCPRIPQAPEGLGTQRHQDWVLPQGAFPEDTLHLCDHRSPS